MEELPENGEITPEHGILIPTIPSVKSIMAYVEAVAVVIGSCHIHSVFEDRENIKIYLKHKRFVDILVNNGVTVLGRQMNVDYYFPRADKVVLSNVDPIVPDTILMKLLCFYGNPVTSIIHEKIASSCEYSHILCGRRKVYMNIASDKKIPTTISFNYLETYYKIHVLVEECDKSIVPENPHEGEEPSDGEISEEVQEIEATDVNVKPNIIELPQRRNVSPKKLAYYQRGKISTDSAVGKLKQRARGGWYKNKMRKVRPRMDDGAGRRVKRLVTKQQSQSTTLKGPRGIMKKRGKRSFVNTLQPTEANEASPEVMETNESFEKMDLSELPTYPLSVKDMEKFLFKTRFNREPTQVAWEFLEEKTPESLEALRNQLFQMVNTSAMVKLKYRIKRIIASLKFTEPAEVVE